MRDGGHKEDLQWAAGTFRLCLDPKDRSQGPGWRSVLIAVLINIESRDPGKDMKKVTRGQKWSLLCRVGTEAPLAFAGHGNACYFIIYGFLLRPGLHHHDHLYQNAHPRFPGRYGLPVVGCVPEALKRDRGRGSEICVATWPKGPFS